MKPRTAKALRWSAILLGGLLLLFALFLIEEHIRGRIELNRYIQQMRARAEKFTIAELTPKPVLPNENGAGLLMGVGFPTTGIVPHQIPNSMRYIAAGTVIPAVSIRAWSASGDYEIRLTTNTNTSTNPADPSISNATTNLPSRGGRSGPGRSGSPNAKAWRIVTAQDLADEIAASSNSLAQVRAALAYPRLDHALAYSQGFSILLPHLAREKSASQWLRAASFSALQETNIAAALENLRALAAFSHATTNEVLMISQLVRIAILHITVAATWEALQAESWNDAQLEELQHALAPNDFVFSMSRALEMERAMGIMTIDQIAQDPTLLKGLIDMDVDVEWLLPSLPESADEALEPFRDLVENLAPAFNRFIYYPVWRFAWKDQDKLNLMRYWQDPIDRGRWQASRPNWTTNKMNMNTTVERESDFYIDAPPRAKYGAVYDRARFLLSSIIQGTASKTLDKAVTAEAAQQLAVSAIAIRRFQLAHGKTPDALDQLVPRFLSAIPIDPFDGQPLRYKRERDGSFMLYSVGQDGKDDSGDASPPTPKGRPNFQNMRDLVWPRAATSEEIQKFIEAEAGRSRRPTAP